MPLGDISHSFDRIFRIVRDPKFLSMQGLGNEEAIFIQPYDVRKQNDVYTQIRALHKRLENDGIATALLSLYDIAMRRFEERNQLEKLFEREQEIDKSRLLKHMEQMLGPERHIAPAVRTEIESAEARLVLLYEVGEVFPYLRTHSVLNNLHTVAEHAPLVVFFPGEYVSSDSEGFYLSLFGEFKGDYYRAFHLEDYIQRGRIDVET